MLLAAEGGKGIDAFSTEGRVEDEAKSQQESKRAKKCQHCLMELQGSDKLQILWF